MSNTTQKLAPDVYLHELTSSASDDQVRKLMAFSASIFHFVPADPNTHTSFAFWRERLARPNASILYVTRDGGPESAPLGFFFDFPTTQKEFGVDNMHVWLAGVDEQARGLGIFPRLLERTVQLARSGGYEYVTIATIPHIFPRMYAILTANKWELKTSRESDRSVLMCMKL